MATFNGRLRQLMKEKGFTQHKLAEAVDVSEPSVYSYYHGFTTPRLDVLVAIAKVFDVTTDYLLGLEDFNAKVLCSAVQQELGIEDAEESDAENTAEENSTEEENNVQQEEQSDNQSDE